jgi:hypothetical protein
MYTAESRTNDRSLGAIVRDLTQDLSTLFRSEVALAKLEVKQAIAAVGGVAAMFAGALVLGLLAAALLFVTAVLGLVEIGVPAWLSTLIVAVVLLVLAGTLVFMGKKKMAKVEFKPSAAVESIKTDISTIKSEIRRAKES